MLWLKNWERRVRFRLLSAAFGMIAGGLLGGLAGAGTGVARGGANPVGVEGAPLFAAFFAIIGALLFSWALGTRIDVYRARHDYRVKFGPWRMGLIGLVVGALVGLLLGLFGAVVGAFIGVIQGCRMGASNEREKRELEASLNASS